MSDKKKLINNLTGALAYILVIVCALLIFKQTGSGDIWYDEVFSVAFVKGSFADVIRYTAMDVHPPLYYLYLKAVTVLLFWTDFVVACKVASFLPLLGLYILSLTWVRRRYGFGKSGVFALLITMMPQLSNYYVEIRMYSFALLLVTLAGCCLVDIIQKRKASKATYIGFFLSCIATAYTQYFACVAVITLYLLLFVSGLISKDRKRIKNALIMAGISIVSYLPWIPFFFKQIKNVTGSYWIQPMTLRSIPGCLKFIFLPVSGEGKITFVAAGFAILIFAAIYLLAIWKLNIKDIDTLACCMMGIAAIAGMVIVGFIASIAGSPIFTYRYMIPALGLLYLGIIIALDKLDNNILLILLVLASLFAGYYGTKNFIWEEERKAEAFDNASVILQNIPEGSVIIANFDHVATIASYYFPDSDVYVYEGETDRLIGELFHGNGSWATDEKVSQLINENDNVYFFGSFVSRDEIVDNWDKIGIKSEYEDECLVERYWFNIYHLGLDNE